MTDQSLEGRRYAGVKPRARRPRPRGEDAVEGGFHVAGLAAEFGWIGLLVAAWLGAILGVARLRRRKWRRSR